MIESININKEDEESAGSPIARNEILAEKQKEESGQLVNIEEDKTQDSKENTADNSTEKELTHDEKITQFNEEIKNLSSDLSLNNKEIARLEQSITDDIDLLNQTRAELSLPPVDKSQASPSMSYRLDQLKSLNLQKTSIESKLKQLKTDRGREFMSGAIVIPGYVQITNNNERSTQFNRGSFNKQPPLELSQMQVMLRDLVPVTDFLRSQNIPHRLTKDGHASDQDESENVRITILDPDNPENPATEETIIDITEALSDIDIQTASTENIKNNKTILEGEELLKKETEIQK